MLDFEFGLNLILDDFKKRGERVLLGVDFPLGFPRGFAAALNLPGEATVDEVENIYLPLSRLLNMYVGGTGAYVNRITCSGTSGVIKTIANYKK